MSIPLQPKDLVLLQYGDEQLLVAVEDEISEGIALKPNLYQRDQVKVVSGDVLSVVAHDLKWSLFPDQALGALFELAKENAQLRAENAELNEAKGRLQLRVNFDDAIEDLSVGVP